MLSALNLALALAFSQDPPKHVEGIQSLDRSCPREIRIEPDPDRNAELTNRVDPKIPECLSGKINSQPSAHIFRAVVGLDGKLCNLRTVRKAEMPKACTDLEPECRKALLEWRYRPATKSGVAVYSELTITCGLHVR